VVQGFPRKQPNIDEKNRRRFRLSFSSFPHRSLSMAKFTMKQVRQHTTQKDAWIALHGKVYNVTPFLPEVRIE
jgi:cytochrome b involved in lipid metabolism